jgi:hypothetical protein
MSKITAVEWFYQRILATDIKEAFEQAKQMEKEQITEAHGVKTFQGREDGVDFWQQKTGEQYYKEQYEREDNKH